MHTKGIGLGITFSLVLHSDTVCEGRVFSRDGYRPLTGIEFASGQRAGWVGGREDKIGVQEIKNEIY